MTAAGYVADRPKLGLDKLEYLLYYSVNRVNALIRYT
jgi:hypothetical protein